MPDVYNWHLGRPMTYPYAEDHPQRQFVAVFNINRCIGCQTCTGSCKATWTFLVRSICGGTMWRLSHMGAIRSTGM